MTAVDRVWHRCRLATLSPVRARPRYRRRRPDRRRDGRIVYAVPPRMRLRFDAKERIDCDGRWITPGLIDCHTHLVYGGNRAHEFEQRLAGASYEEIARAGGGIVSTVKATRQASEDDLVAARVAAARRADRRGRHDHRNQVGLRPRARYRTPAVAGGAPARRRKRGVGANHLSRRACRAAGDERRTRPAISTRSATRCCRRSPPKDWPTPSMPFVKTSRSRPSRPHKCFRQGARRSACRFAFTPISSRTCTAPRWPRASARFRRTTSNMPTRTASRRWRAAGTVAVVLPGAFYFIREKQVPPIDVMRRHGVPIALATDSNPGTSPLTSLLLAMNMGATLFRLTVDECIAAVTREAARALGLFDETGSLDAGKYCDLAIWDIERPAELVYRIGFNPLHARVWRGSISDSRDSTVARRSSQPARNSDHDPHRQRPRDPRRARQRAFRQILADRSADADADEQSRSGCRGKAQRTRGLWRHRPRGARLGKFRSHRRDAEAPRRRRDAAGAIGQAGRRVPHPCRRAARADRQLQPGAALGDLGAFQRARSQGPDDVRPDDRRLLDLHRQPGHHPGHLRDLRRTRPPALWRRPLRQMDPDRRSRRHGRRAAARRGDGRRVAAWRSNASRRGSRCGCAPAISTARPTTSTKRWTIMAQAGRDKKPVSVGLLGNAAEIFPELVRRGVRPDVVTDQTSAHDPVNGYLPKGWTTAEWEARRESDPKGVGAAARASMAEHVRAMLDFHRMGIPVVDYGNNIRQMALEEGVKDAFDFPGFVPAYIRPLFCRGIGPFRWAALSGDPEDIYRTDAKVKELMPDNAALHHWLDMARAAHRVPGPARADLLGRSRRPPPARACLQRDGGARRIEGAGRDRPRPSRFRFGRLAQPRNRSDAGRLRRGVRLAAAQCAAELRQRRHLGVAAPWRRRRHGLLAACRHGDRLRRHAGGGAADRRVCCGTIPRPA